MKMTKFRQYSICSLCLLLISCSHDIYRTLQYTYKNGEVCRQFYDSDSDQIRCECKVGPSTNFTKYRPNFYRTSSPTRPGVDAYCLTPDEYLQLK